MKDDAIELTEGRSAAHVTGRGECPACGAEALWRLTVTGLSLGTGLYWSACTGCRAETTHSIDLLTGIARSWESGLS
jgi:hypothetical protein